MTAICLFRQDDAMIFASDGLSYDGDGRVLHYVTKLYPIPHLNCVFTHAGQGRVGVIVMDLINRGMVGRQFDTFDALLDCFIPLCQEAYDVATSMTLEELGGNPTDLYIRSTFVLGGWSDRSGRYEVVKTSSFDKELFLDASAPASSVTPAWTVQAVDEFYINHWPRDRADEFGLMANDVPVLDYLVRAVCACRADSAIDADGVYCVGGYLQMVYVNREKIVSWVAHRWPDRVGQTIDPTVGEPLPQFPITVP